MSDTKKQENTFEYKKLTFDVEETVSSKIKENGAKKILDIVVDQKIEEETTRRVEIVKKAFAKYNDLKAKVDQLKPDVKGSFTAAGVRGADTYSETAWNNKVNMIKEMNNIVDALDAYHKENNFDKLEKFK